MLDLAQWAASRAFSCSLSKSKIGPMDVVDHASPDDDELVDYLYSPWALLITLQCGLD